MPEVIMNIGWAVVFSAIGGVVGIALILAATSSIPKVLDKLTTEQQLQWYYQHKRAV